jgi:hypothetical protein
MQLLHEAGVFGYATVALFTVACVVVVRTKISSTPFALALLALGQLGQGAGQRVVRDACETVVDVQAKLSFLNIGSGEAAANLVISGMTAIVLVALAAILRTQRR